MNAVRLLNECRLFGFDTTPPLPIRVMALDTDRLSMGQVEDYSLYHYMFKLLRYEESRRKLYKFRSEENLKLFDMTSPLLETWPKKLKRVLSIVAYVEICRQS